MIRIQREETSYPIDYDNVINAYTKGPMYCVLFENDEGDRVTHKYPLCSLFRVVEDYQPSMRNSPDKLKIVNYHRVSEEFADKMRREWGGDDDK